MIHRAGFHCTTVASELLTTSPSQDSDHLNIKDDKPMKYWSTRLVQPACESLERFVCCGKIRSRDRGDRRVTLEERVCSRQGQLQTYNLQEACGYMDGDAYFHFQCSSVSLAPQKRCASLVHCSVSDGCGILTIALLWALAKSMLNAWDQAKAQWHTIADAFPTI